jgi:hypothetical protein
MAVCATWSTPLDTAAVLASVVEVLTMRVGGARETRDKLETTISNRFISEEEGGGRGDYH